MRRIYKTLSVLLVSLLLALSSTSTALALTWDVMWTGYGSVFVDDDFMQLIPQAVQAPSQTSSALVVSEDELFDDFELHMTVQNMAQLRQNSAPNPWEAPWIVFGYKDDVSASGGPDESFVYLILKPDGYGLELGEARPDDEQNFMWTSPVGLESYNIGQSYDVEIRVKDNELTVTIDGMEKFTFSDPLDRTISYNGRYGCYTEDANIICDNIQVVDLNETEPYTNSQRITNNTLANQFLNMTFPNIIYYSAQRLFRASN